MMRADPIGLYLHIPFCLQKCNYCDFCSFANVGGEARDAYISSLEKEIRSYRRGERVAVDTVFFGGGTPSLLSPSEFERLCRAIDESFAIDGNIEFTVEANPKTLDRDKLYAYRSLGVNRISIGLQSIHENELKMLGRIHTLEDFKKTYDLALSSGISNLNIDVMYGIPEQTEESFIKTLEFVTSLSPTHISAYGLILEENTKFWRMKETLSLPDEDAERAMYDLTCELLSSRGYSHYEISNYAKDGYESRHNLKYWRCEEYIGVGLSAHSYFNGKRYAVTDDMSVYLSPDKKQYISVEEFDTVDRAYEHVMLSLRLREGLDLDGYRFKFGFDFLEGRKELIDRYISGGFLQIQDNRLRLTEKGFYVSNTILTDLL